VFQTSGHSGKLPDLDVLKKNIPQNPNNPTKKTPCKLFLKAFWFACLHFYIRSVRVFFFFFISFIKLF